MIPVLDDLGAVGCGEAATEIEDLRDSRAALEAEFRELWNERAKLRRKIHKLTVALQRREVRMNELNSIARENGWRAPIDQEVGS